LRQADRDRLADLGDPIRVGATRTGRGVGDVGLIGSGRSSSLSRSLTYCAVLLTRSASCFFESLPERRIAWNACASSTGSRS
jgi:hypothetical protein